MSHQEDDEPDEDIEEEAEFVSGPTETEHDIKFKDGEEPPEEDEDVEEPDEDVEEEAEFVSGPGENEHDIKFKDPKDDDKDDKPEDKEEPEEPEDVEEEAEFVSGPGVNEHDIKFKDPTDDDAKEPDENEDPDAPKEPDDVEAEADFVSGPKDKDHDIKYKEPEPAVPQWQPKPRPPPEPIEFPPKEKTLFEKNKEEKISPTKRYAKKPCTRTVLIPFVIPWEQSAAKQTQHGMGAFGKGRNPFTKVDQGAKELKQGTIHSESTLTLFTQCTNLASRKGEHSFGAHRSQVGIVIDHHDFDTNNMLKLSEGIVPKQAGGGMERVSQSGQTPMGAIRKQVADIKYRDWMDPKMDPQGNTFISRQWMGNPNNHAGSGVMDRRRNVVSNIESAGGSLQKHHRLTEGIIPRLFDTQDLEKPSGTGAGYSGLGAFRQVVTKTEGGYGMTYEEEVACKRWVPYQTGASLTSQAQGGGGFSKTRDVVHVNF